MKVAIIDDLVECRNDIRSCLRQFFSQHYAQESYHIEEFISGEEFLSVFKKDSYDLIFIDQYMNGLSGMEFARQIRMEDDLVSLVFITTSKDHAIDSYQVRAGGYLLKPFSYEDFDQTLLLLDMTRLRNARYICVQDENILLREILWCDIDGHYMQIHTLQHGDLRYRIPFTKIADILKEYPQFLTCYKGCIINLERVERMEELAFLMETGDRVLFSKRDRKSIENGYHNYLFHKAREEELL